MAYILARRATTIFRRLTPSDTQRLACLSLRTSTGTQSTSLASNAGIVTLPLRLRNSYATATARPKAHTGRAAASKKPRPQGTTAKKPTKKTTKKRVSKSKPKPKSRAKSKATKKPKRKALTDKQKETLKKKKERQEIKELKIAALSPPKALPHSPFGLMLQQMQHGGISEKTAAYKNLSASELERLRAVAKENVEANREAFAQWVKSHTALQIKEANTARRRLRRLTKRSVREISDSRQVKRPKTSYIIFAQEKLQSGEFDHLELTKKMVHIGQTWRNLSSAEQEKYVNLAKEATEVYMKEYQSVYGQQPPKRQSKKAAATL
ncbi:hypothetical protein LOZ65_002905 [Ophidiomyces ophidiicola]|nr:hypothetical protein LOZ65_002905 [Ophidiomyces ophidiicola]